MKVDFRSCGNQSMPLEYLISIRAEAEKVNRNIPQGRRAGAWDLSALFVPIKKAGERDDGEPEKWGQKRNPFQDFQVGKGDPEKNDGDAREHIPESVLQRPLS